MKKNVYELTQERLKYIFDNFDNVYVSFSGGKDSGILLNLCIDYIKSNNLKRKIGVMHIDYEAQYQDTTDYVDKMLEGNKDILDVYRICMPIKAQCATSMYQSYWIPWQKSKKDLWVRDLPKNSINEDNHTFDFWKNNMWDYDFQKMFILWYHKKMKARKTIDLIGIRTQESLNRWRALNADCNYKRYNNINWIKPALDGKYDGIYNAYPIFDWKTEDIWIANGKFNFEYNKLYDLYYKAGLDINEMRVASPFNDCATNTLKLYKIIDPKNWAKMIGRVNGVNFTAIYGGTTAMGWKSITLPSGYTWESYMYFLLDTLPEKTRNMYLEKLETSKKFWKEKGGVLEDKTIQLLKEKNVKINVKTTTNYHTSKKPVQMSYLDDINCDEFSKVPTYKRVCVCIMKNDHLCKYMGFSQTKEETKKRKEAIQKWKNLL